MAQDGLCDSAKGVRGMSMLSRRSLFRWLGFGAAAVSGLKLSPAAGVSSSSNIISNVPWPQGQTQGMIPWPPHYGMQAQYNQLRSQLLMSGNAFRNGDLVYQGTIDDEDCTIETSHEDEYDD
jgi:hypothetical protein